MAAMTIMKRSLRVGLPVLILVCGCKDGEEMTTASSSTGAASSTVGATGSATDTGGATGTGEVPTSGDPTGPVTGEPPVPCETPEGCTAMGSGEIASTTVPFFRGEVCLSDKLRPGDPLALSVSTCTHPCLTITNFAFKWVYRCEGAACELGFVFYHPEVTGSECPSDVFGEFDPALCVFTDPAPLTITPPEATGDVSLLLPFLTNDDATAIAGGDNESSSVWARVDAHMQAPGRRVVMNFAADNPQPPAACTAEMPGCTCSKIGLP